MTDLQSVMALFDSLAQFPTLIMIVATLAIVALTVAFSGQNNPAIRLIYLIGLAGAVYVLARQFDDVNGDFFLNISTELIGAMLVLVILGSHVPRHPWLILVITALIVLSTVPVGLVDEDVQPILSNLSAELLGAFIIFILLQRRDWLWNSGKRARSREVARQAKLEAAQRAEIREEMQRELRQAVAQARAEERQHVQEVMEAEMERWRTQESWDVAIKVAGDDRDHLKRKVRAMRSTFKNLKVCKLEEDTDAGYAHCYLLARVTIEQGQPAHTS